MMAWLEIIKVFCIFSVFSSISWSHPTIPGFPTSNNIKWCTTSNAEQAKCLALSRHIANNADKTNETPHIQCEQRLTRGQCMWDVGQGSLDIVNLVHREIYLSGKWYRLIPVVGESIQGINIDDSDENESGEAVSKPYAYKAVVVIRRNNTNIQKINDLRGAKSCHTFYGRNAGWAIPLSLLMAKGLLTSKDCLSNINAVSKFFSQSCASGTQDNFNNFLDEDVSNLCSLCSDDSATKCTINDKYAGYEGSFKCLQDGRGDIAFTKHDIVASATKGETQPGRRLQDFVLLCPGGSRKRVDEYNECNWGTVPPGSIMASPHLNAAHRRKLRNFFLKLKRLLPDSFNPFESASLGGQNLLFSDKTKNLFDPETEDYKTYVGPSYIRSMENQTTQCDSSVPSTMRWCVVSSVEVAKCHQMQLAFEFALVKPKIQCVPADSVRDCMAKIRDGTADLITLDGGDIYAGGQDFGLIPIMYEDYGQHSAKYWAVAVVKKCNPGISFPNLRGRKSCHTGVGRTAGWNVPISILGAENQISLNNPCNILKNVADYFNASCAPGVLDFNHEVPVNKKNNLCALCKGEGVNRCARKADEPYYGYTGALRCLVEGGGDVAFVNHLTVQENTNGNNGDAWAKHLKPEDFELLCRDGGRQPVDQYRQCHLAKVPAHAVVTAGSKTQLEIKAFSNALLKGQDRYADDTNNRFRMFDSGPGTKNVLFRDATKRLVLLPVDQQNCKSYLGNYIDTARSVDIKQCKQ